MSKELFLQQAQPTPEQRRLLEGYASLLIDWNRRINLIGAATVNDLWQRHLLDCCGLLAYLKPGQSVVDLGSGAGPPGVVLAIMTRNPVTLVEARGKRVVFLQEVAARLGLGYRVVEGRAETLKPETRFDVITARAVASLSRLWQWSQHWRKPDGCGIFLKGQQCAVEITDLRQQYPDLVVKSCPHAHQMGQIVILSGRAA